MATAESGGVSLGEATAKSMLNDKNEWQVKQTRRQQPGPSSAFDTASSSNIFNRYNNGHPSSVASTYSQTETNGTRSNKWARAPVSLVGYSKNTYILILIYISESATAIVQTRRGRIR